MSPNKLPSNPQFDKVLEHVEPALRRHLDAALQGRYYWKVVCVASLVMNALLVAKILLRF